MIREPEIIKDFKWSDLHKKWGKVVILEPTESCIAEGNLNIEVLFLTEDLELYLLLEEAHNENTRFDRVARKNALEIKDGVIELSNKEIELYKKDLEQEKQRRIEAEKVVKLIDGGPKFSKIHSLYTKKINDLEQRLEEAEEALKFYADEENYKPQDYKGMHNLPPISGEYVPLSDNGDTARRYFKKHKDNK